jgi:hypothetical protein
MEIESFKLCSTEGDFDLDSQFTLIPGSLLTITVDRSSILLVSSRVMIQGNVQLQLLLNGSRILCFDAQQDFVLPFSADLSMTSYLPAGIHQIGVSAKSDNSAGPRDWSPRWGKEGKPFGKVIRSEDCPLLIVAVVQKV